MYVLKCLLPFNQKKYVLLNNNIIIIIIFNNGVGLNNIFYTL